MNNSDKRQRAKRRNDVVEKGAMPGGERTLFADLKELVASARRRVAAAANSEIVLLHWNVGKRVKEEILGNKRAAYGKEIVKKVSAFLTEEFGKGWGERTVLHCIRSAYAFSEAQIVYAARIQLGWTHLRSIMFLDDPVKRQFYLTMCAHEHWSARQLDVKIDGMLYERTAISRKPREIVEKELARVQVTDELSPDLVFRSSYFLNLTGLKDEYSENDLENAILDQIETALEEFGTDFAFLGRQRRITVDATDYKMDLLFFHRSLKRLVVVDLKLGKFRPEYEGQMKLYLRYLDKNDRKEGENAPIGLVLCSEGNTEHIEYLMLDEEEIRVAQYFTQLPSKALLKRKLQKAVRLAQAMKAVPKT